MEEATTKEATTNSEKRSEEEILDMLVLRQERDGLDATRGGWSRRLCIHGTRDSDGKPVVFHIGNTQEKVDTHTVREWEKAASEYRVRSNSDRAATVDRQIRFVAFSPRKNASYSLTLPGQERYKCWISADDLVNCKDGKMPVAMKGENYHIDLNYFRNQLNVMSASRKISEQLGNFKSYLHESIVHTKHVDGFYAEFEQSAYAHMFSTRHIPRDGFRQRDFTDKTSWATMTKQLRDDMKVLPSKSECEKLARDSAEYFDADNIVLCDDADTKDVRDYVPA